jgi:hypothetical protein
MPRGPRLDTPGVLHHVMVRGLGWSVHACALLPDHLRLLVRTRRPPGLEAAARPTAAAAGSAFGVMPLAL